MKKFRDSRKVKTNHAKTRLRDLSKTLPRFRDPAKIFREPCFSRYHSPPLYVLCPTLQTRTCIGVLKSIIMFFLSFIAMEYAFTLFFFTVNSSINAAGDYLAGRSFMEKELNSRLFPELRNQFLWCSG